MGRRRRESLRHEPTDREYFSSLQSSLLRVDWHAGKPDGVEAALEGDSNVSRSPPSRLTS